MPPRRTRWLLRLCLALLLAAGTWWAVYELLTPQPVFSFPVFGERHVSAALVVGPWCVMDIDWGPPILPSRTCSVYDTSTQRMHDRDRRFGLEAGFRTRDFTATVQQLKNCDDRYVYQQKSTSSFRLFDTLTDKIRDHDFPATSSIETNEKCTHVWEVSKLPVSPFLALSTGPLSSLPACWMTTQKNLFPGGVENVVTLVRVHQLPKVTVAARFALPPHPARSTLHLTASGRYLIRLFSVDEQFEERIIGGDGLRPDGWMKPRVAKLQLQSLPPETACHCDVYDAVTGNLASSHRIEYHGKPIRYFCSALRHDWAFLMMIDPWEVKADEPSPRKRLSPLFCALHLPTGQQIPADQLPPYFWDRWRAGMVASGTDGSALGSVFAPEKTPLVTDSYQFGYLAPGDKSHIELYRFHADGTAARLRTFNTRLPGLMPGKDRYYIITSRFEQLPRWLTFGIKYLPWLREKLREPVIRAFHADSGSSLWTKTLDDEEDWPGPRAVITADGGHLLVPISTGAPPSTKAERHRFDVYVYRLPLSPWIDTAPMLAALTVLALWMSQGFAWFRWPRRKIPAHAREHIPQLHAEH